LESSVTTAPSAPSFWVFLPATAGTTAPPSTAPLSTASIAG